MRLSVIVVAYDMARELPRTLVSLAPPYQRGVSASDYEIIVVDNGSPDPVPAEAVERAAPGAIYIQRCRGDVSPVPAINEALDRARGDLVCVMIDGARMASPGLLATALEAARLSPEPVIGAHGFHLGPDIQMRSIKDGYTKDREDALLAEAGWQNDGYRLFDVSVFAGSSIHGWFVVPAEVNALFLRRSLWSVLGGYDPGFTSAGGGLCNLDMWSRACAVPGAGVTLLLGEGTFHQMHGGVMTNAKTSRWDEFNEEHERVRGAPYRVPGSLPAPDEVLFHGRLSPARAAELLGPAERDQSGRTSK